MTAPATVLFAMMLKFPDLALDTNTIVSITTVLAVLLSLMLALTYFNQRQNRGLGYWALGIFFYGIGWGLSLPVDGNYPPINFLAGSGLRCLGMATLAIGVLSYKKQKINWWLLGGYVLVFVGVILLTSVVFPNPILRRSLLALIGAVPLAYSAQLLLKPVQPLQLRAPFWSTGIVFLILALNRCIRAADIVLHETTADIVKPGALGQTFLAMDSVFFVALSFCFLLMIHVRMAIDMEKLASVDSLTGALNRRSLGEHAAKLTKRRGDQHIGIIMLDIDLFKSVNDRYGHQAGDKVLQHLASTAQSVLRGVDYFARVGGEEFCALLTESDESMTALVAERIRVACAKSHVTYRGQRIHYTTSAGVSAGNPTTSSLEKLIGEADQCLYLAKNTGRNRVVRWSQMHEMVDTETFAKAQIQDQQYSFTASNFRSPDDPVF